MARLNPAVGQNLHWEVPVLDVQYPEWARRSNPIVRRHLGVYVKTFPPQFRPLFSLFLIQAVLVLLSVPLPFLFTMIMPLTVVAILMMPIAFYFYFQVLWGVTRDAPNNMLKESQHNTLHLLRVTPLTSRQILLGKIAAALWRRVDDINLVLFSAITIGLPIIFVQYANVWDPGEHPFLIQLGMLVVFGVSVIRVVLEPFMVAAIGVMAGAVIPSRSVAQTATGLLTFFYFLIVNLPRLLNLSLPMRVVVEGIFPVVLPLAIAWGAMSLATHFMTRD